MRMTRCCGWACLLWFVCIQGASAQLPTQAIRGVTVGPVESVHLATKDYGTRASAALLDELKRLGVNWISLTPYGRMWSTQSTHIWHDLELDYARKRVGLIKMIRQAHARHIKVMVIPSLWIEMGGHRLDINPGSPARWHRFLQAYREFVMAWALPAAEAKADAISLGVEMRSISGQYFNYWHTLIDDLRRFFPGWLTYNANWWREVDQVIFWDKLDAIGIQAFYELSTRKPATLADYRKGAAQILSRVQHTQRTHHKPILFTEIGYSARPNTGVEPWAWPQDLKSMPFDEEDQTRAYQAMLESFLPQPWFMGFFIWRYYSDPDDTSQEPIWSFSPHAKKAEHYLNHTFHHTWAYDHTLDLTSNHVDSTWFQLFKYYW